MEMTPAAVPAAAPAFIPHLEPSMPIALSAVDQQTALTDLKDAVAKGRLSPEQATTAFDELGIPVEQRTDTRSDEVKELDSQFPPAAKPEDYLIHHGVDAMTPELKSFDTAARSWLHSAELPRELGNSFVTTLVDVAKTTGTMTADQRDLYGKSEMGKLRKLFGDTLQPRMEAAKRMIHALDAKQPGLKQLIRANASFDNARVVVQLLDASDRYWARRK